MSKRRKLKEHEEIAWVRVVSVARWKNRDDTKAVAMGEVEENDK
jgi:hypothetical protein